MTAYRIMNLFTVYYEYIKPDFVITKFNKFTQVSLYNKPVVNYVQNWYNNNAEGKYPLPDKNLTLRHLRLPIVIAACLRATHKYGTCFRLPPACPGTHK